MLNITKNAPGGEQPIAPWILTIMLFAYVIAAYFLFAFIGYAVCSAFYSFDFGMTLESIQNPLGSEKNKMPLFVLQFISSFGAFVAAPWFFIVKNLKLSIREVCIGNFKGTWPYVMAFVITGCFIVANSILIEWNQNFVFPESMRSLETKLIEMESSAKVLTEYLTDFSSNTQFLIALVVIAVLPGIGEELLFRGLLQPLFFKISKNPHVAIWFTAFLFSAFHFQFYGLLPRMMLGVLFGYLYYWSGSLSVAMIAHFFNNAFSLTLYYLSQNRMIEISPEDLEQAPSYPIVIGFFIAGIVLLFLFRKYFSISTNE